MVSEEEQEGAIWNVASVLRFATQHFQSRGIEAARLEAELLLGELLGLDRVGLVVHSMRPLSESELSSYRELLKRRRSGEPVAYILGRREFFGLSFSVDRHVLVPRPETELLVEEALLRTKHRELSGRALDLCTGSGCVAISFAKARPTWQTFATDLSEEALGVARKNALDLGVVWNLSFHQGDLLEACGRASRFELIVCNPPYIPNAELDTLAPEVRDHEPRMALDGGADGLDFYKRLVKEAPSHLVPGGVLAVEIGADQGGAVMGLFRAHGFTETTLRQDFAGNDRVISGKNAAKPAGRQEPGRPES
jgi:release factor glutamine methyltransferase